MRNEDFSMALRREDHRHAEFGCREQLCIIARCQQRSQGHSFPVIVVPVSVDVIMACLVDLVIWKRL